MRQTAHLAPGTLPTYLGMPAGAGEGGHDRGPGALPGSAGGRGPHRPLCLALQAHPGAFPVRSAVPQGRRLVSGPHKQVQMTCK